MYYIRKLILILFKDKFRKVNRINKTFYGKSAEYIIFASAISLHRAGIA